MPRFRKRPIVVEAEQWFRKNDALEDFFYIETLEGSIRVNSGDWIITGVMGEIYPCKNEIFQMTYEPA